MTTRAPVQSVQRALEMLKLFTPEHPQLPLRALAEGIGIPKSTARRLAMTLIQHGFLDQFADGSYALGGQVFQLAATVGAHGPVETAAAAAARLMARATGHAVIVARADWLDLSTLVTRRIAGAADDPRLSRPGRRVGFSPGSISKALLAATDADATAIVDRMTATGAFAGAATAAPRFMADISTSRAQGWATSIDEFIPGVAGVAAAVRVDGRPVGAVAVVAPTANTTQRQLDEWGQLLRDALERAPRPIVA